MKERPHQEQQDEKEGSPGPRLSLVGMPIGNPKDITLRALETLAEADLLLCEERKTASRYYKIWNIPFPREAHFLLNEHTSLPELEEIKGALLRARSTVLISEAGMPVFCDPGKELLLWARSRGVAVDVVPGPVALTVALVQAGVGMDGFFFAGFPPREREEREGFFRGLNDFRKPVAFYETPYRTGKVLEELHRNLPAKKKVFVVVGATMDNESVLQCEAGRLPLEGRSLPKGPPVFIIYDE